MMVGLWRSQGLFACLEARRACVNRRGPAAIYARGHDHPAPRFPRIAGVTRCLAALGEDHDPGG